MVETSREILHTVRDYTITDPDTHTDSSTSGESVTALLFRSWSRVEALFADRSLQIVELVEDNENDCIVRCINLRKELVEAYIVLHTEDSASTFFDQIRILERLNHPLVSTFLGGQVEPDLLIYFLTPHKGQPIEKILHNKNSETDLRHINVIHMCRELFSFLNTCSQSGILPQGITLSSLLFDILSRNETEATLVGVTGVQRWLLTSTLRKRYPGQLVDIMKQKEVISLQQKVLQDLQKILFQLSPHTVKAQRAIVNQIQVELSKQHSSQIYDMKALAFVTDNYAGLAREILGQQYRSLQHFNHQTLGQKALEDDVLSLHQETTNQPRRSHLLQVLHWLSLSFSRLRTAVREQLSVWRGPSTFHRKTEMNPQYGEDEELKERNTWMQRLWTKNVRKRLIVLAIPLSLIVLVLVTSEQGSDLEQVAGNVLSKHKDFVSKQVSGYGQISSSNGPMSSNSTDDTKASRPTEESIGQKDSTSPINQTPPQTQTLPDELSVREMFFQAVNTFQECSEHHINHETYEDVQECIATVLSPTSPMLFLQAGELASHFSSIPAPSQIPPISEMRVELVSDFGDIVLYRIGLAADSLSVDIDEENKSASQFSIALERYGTDWLIRSLFWD